MATLDLAKEVPNGWHTLGKVLEYAEDFNLKFVFARGVEYSELLRSKGFVLAWHNRNTGDDRFGDVGIWVKEGISPMRDTPRRSGTPLDILWGIFPLLFLVVTLGLLALRPAKKGHHSSVEAVSPLGGFVSKDSGPRIWDKFYSRRKQKGVIFYHQEPLVRALCGLIEISGKTVLEVGCGPARDSIQLAKMGARACCP